MQLTRERVPVLARAHIAAGEKDLAAIGDVIRRDFVDAVLEGLPGSALYVSGRGMASTGAREQARVEAGVRFEASRWTLRQEVEDIVRRTLVEHPPKTPWERLTEWSRKSAWIGLPRRRHRGAHRWRSERSAQLFAPRHTGTQGERRRCIAEKRGFGRRCWRRAR